MHPRFSARSAPHRFRSLVLVCITFLCASRLHAGDGWVMHTIDRSSRGADGVRLGDVNKDGRLDIVTGWEEGGQIRICLQPLKEDVREPWPSVRVGSVKSPEDAVFADVNGDGWLDVISCCEGKQQAVFFHLNPGGEQLMNSGAWNTEVLPSSQQASRWMFCEPLPDGRLVLGSKEPHGQISIYDMRTQQMKQLRKCGWIMSLRNFDVDRDGDSDIVYSDRKGDARCVGWLQNPGSDQQQWNDHVIGGKGLEVMFLDLADAGGQVRIVCNTRNGHLLDMSPGDHVEAAWNVKQISHPPASGAGKAVAICDVNEDGQPDLVCTCGLAERKYGVFWLEQPGDSVSDETTPQSWDFHDISGTEIGVKFDRIEMLDIDGDGDKDLLTCEERHNLGVVWYENPLHSTSSDR